MSEEPVDRRRFLYQAAAGVGALSAGLAASADDRARQVAVLPQSPGPMKDETPERRLPYRGPNVILIRFGGGVRRLETIFSPDNTYCPFVYHELVKKRGPATTMSEPASAPDRNSSA